MTLNDFQAKLKAITRDSEDIYTSPDFQCDQTGGFPTSLCVCWEKGKAWLQLNESMIMDGQDVSKYEQYCADFGFRSCYDTDDFNKLLRELGEDAFQTAYLPSEDEDEGMVM
ncbi:MULTISPECIES: hypothetical protein [unclassified Ruminococcus]|uniref:hypothetical protein n=1 Tax=unclassified Ruminococcus TaxID=2608920 RepID=UPI00210E4A3F|nr:MULTISPECIES: hypothetical protein [unclassified Ruminococcus]MCQ4022418.1 hypothetical protein [Ruminococcus sp. zg-924]MCQ4114746.1 hypothetical protein [Ruminococcus sp. zg-921]